jgi:hypothetical protein
MQASQWPLNSHPCHCNHKCPGDAGIWGLQNHQGHEKGEEEEK